MAATTYIKNKLLDLTFGQQAYTGSAVLWVGLCTACDVAGTVTGEPPGAGYARVSIDNNDVATVWSAANAGVKANANSTLVFPTVTTSSWGTLSVAFLADSSSAGNVIWYGALNNAVTLTPGMAPHIPVNNLQVSLT